MIMYAPRPCFLLLFLSTLLLNCKSSDDHPKIEDLAGIEWRLRYVSEDGLGITAPALDSTYSITFSTDGGFTAKDDCNVCVGNFTLDGGTIEFDGPTCTEIACSTPYPVIPFSNEIQSASMVDIIGRELVLSLNARGKKRSLHFTNPESDARPEKVIMAKTENFARANWAGGSYTIVEDSIAGDILFLRVGYSGCGPHQFDMVISNYFMESEPVQVNAILPNVAELCAAAFGSQLQFDLTPLKRAFQEGYGENGTIIINFPEPFSGTSSVRYEF